MRRSPSAMVGLVLVAILVVMAAGAPIIAPHDPLQVNFGNQNMTPSWDHWLGTDHFGRDIFSRLLYGAQISVFLGLGSVMIGAVTGVSMGLISGYIGGWFDTILMRFVDIMLAFRLILFAIIVMAILGPSVTNVMVAIGISLFASFVRLTRGEVLVAKERDYVQAAVALGASWGRITIRHVLPNILGPLIIFATLRLGVAILAESALSFLGLGPSPPTPAWGLMVREGLDRIRDYWWLSTIPGIAITLVVLSFNLLGDGVRDLLDPRLRSG
jgi:peptide/nickel transport system permease protein